MKSNAKVTHQDINISDTRGILVRQDRIECDPERNIIKLSANKYGRVVNISSFGIAVETDFPVESEYRDCSYLVDNYEICEVTIAKVRSQTLSNGKIITGFSVHGSPLDVEAALAIKALNELLVENTSSQNEDNALIEHFRLKVFEIKDVLSRLEIKVNELSPSSFQHDLSLVTNYENRVADRVSTYISQTLTPIFFQLKEVLQQVNKDELGKYFDFFRRSLGHIMYQSSYAHRAYYKPKGYAGDYEMMNHVYKRELRGGSLFGKCLQRYFVDEPAGKAVRNRELYLRNKIVDIYNNTSEINSKNKLRILSVASGPAMEIQNLVSEHSLDFDNIEFHLLDQDLDALKHAQRKIREIAFDKKINVNLYLHNLAIKNVIQEGLPIKGFNLIYSAGLFDYFTDPVALYAAQKLHDGLLPDGVAVIGNFSVNNPNQLVMGLVMDWNLVYRSELKMQELFGKIGKGYKLEQEKEGINLFANITK